MLLGDTEGNISLNVTQILWTPPASVYRDLLIDINNRPYFPEPSSCLPVRSQVPCKVSLLKYF